jgi:hypothetical protein
MMQEFLTRLPLLAVTETDKARLRQSGTEGGSIADTMDLFKTFDWRWLMYFLAAALLVFGLILFTMLFIRRMQTSRLLFFLVTSTVFVIRVLNPNDRIYLAVAAAGIVLSLIFLAYVVRGGKKADRREPIYYLFNALTFVIMCLPMKSYDIMMAATSLFMSLFFITTRAAKPAGKYTKTDADPFIISQLEKRAKKKH